MAVAPSLELASLEGSECVAERGVGLVDLAYECFVEGVFVDDGVGGDNGALGAGYEVAGPG